MPISEAMRAANRANARRSTGPRTEAGKAAARLNALKHGLAGKAVLLPHEDEAEFAALGADLAARFAPESDMEREAVREMAGALWRLGRVAQAEVAALLANADDDELLALNPTAAALGAPGAIDVLLRISRYESEIHRSYERARDRLAALKRARASAAPHPAPAKPAAAAGTKPQFPAGNGFVSSNPLRPPPVLLATAPRGSVRSPTLGRGPPAAA